jgi:hypothetical protein
MDHTVSRIQQMLVSSKQLKILIDDLNDLVLESDMFETKYRFRLAGIQKCLDSRHRAVVRQHASIHKSRESFLYNTFGIVPHQAIGAIRRNKVALIAWYRRIQALDVATNDVVDVACQGRFADLMVCPEYDRKRVQIRSLAQLFGCCYRSIVSMCMMSKAG